MDIIDEAIAALELERELGHREFELAAPAPVASAPTAIRGYDFVFLHDRPLSPKGVEFMAKAVLGLKRTSESAPLIIVRAAQALPQAQIYVVLGQRTLKVVAPGLSAAVNTWAHDAEGRELFITFTPEYFLRFQVITPAIEQLKRAMWQGLKQVANKVKK